MTLEAATFPKSDVCSYGFASSGDLPGTRCLSVSSSLKISTLVGPCAMRASLATGGW